MEKRTKIILLVGGILATAGIIYLMTRNSSGATTGTSYVPDGTGGNAPATNPDGTPATDSAGNPLPAPQTMAVSPAVRSSKGAIAFRTVTYLPNGGATVAYFDASMNPIVLDHAEGLLIAGIIKKNKLQGVK